MKDSETILNNLNNLNRFLHKLSVNPAGLGAPTLNFFVV
jgi:hypothetical protein